MTPGFLDVEVGGWVKEPNIGIESLEVGCVAEEAVLMALDRLSLQSF